MKASAKQPKDIQFTEEEPENSLALLAKIQEEAEREQKVKHQETGTVQIRKGAPIWSVALLGACCVALAVACVSIWYGMSRKIEEMQADYRRGELYQQRLSERVEQLNEIISEQKEELFFWEDYAVIVTEEGEKYHTYGCQYIQGKGFLIYNIGTATQSGYEPCSVCNPPGTLQYRLNRMTEGE